MRPMNLTYMDLTEKSPVVKNMYEDFDKAGKEIQKMLNRKYHNRGKNILDALEVFTDAQSLLPVYQSAVEATYNEKARKVRSEFIKPTDATLGDCKLAVEYLDGLSTGNRYEALQEHPELRSLFSKNMDVFGVGTHVQTREMIDELLDTKIREEAGDAVQAYEALPNLTKTFESGLKSLFEDAGGFAAAEEMMVNYIETQREIV